LTGADLSGAVTEGAVLKGAHYDAQTCWPDDFKPKWHGAVLVEQTAKG